MTSVSLLTVREAAAYLSVSPSFLNKARRLGGPRFCRLGRSVRYRREALDEWAASLESPDSDAARAA